MSENIKQYSRHFLDRFVNSGFGRVINDSLVMNAGYYLGNVVVNSAGGFLFWYFAARLYTQDQVGISSSLYSASQLLSGIAALGFGIGLARFLPRAENPNQLLNSAILVTTVASMGVGGIYIVSMPSASNLWAFFDNNIGYQFGFIVFVAALTLFTILVPAFISSRQGFWGFMQFVLMNALRFLLIFLFAFLSEDGIIFATFLGVLVPVGISMHSFVPRVFPGFKFRLNWNYEKTKSILGYSFGNYLANVLYLMPGWLSPLIALEILGEQASAKVYIAWMFGMFAFSPGAALARSSLVEASYEPDQMRNLLLRSFRLALGITTPVAIVFGLGARVIVSLYGEAYIEGTVDLLRWLVYAAPFATLNSLYFTILQVRKSIGEIIILSALIAGIAVGWPWIGLLAEGVVAVGRGWLFANLIISLYAGFKVLGAIMKS